jgi:predicted DNA-binding transcriptional regulator AlpA
MNESSGSFEIVLEGLIRRVIREEISSLKTDAIAEDRLLEAGDAAKLLSVSEDWIYRNAKKLPFTRKLGSKMLRFSAIGIQRYLATRK